MRMRVTFVHNSQTTDLCREKGEPMTLLPTKASREAVVKIQNQLRTI